MKQFKISYTDNEGKKKSEKIVCMTNSSARIAFKQKHAGKFKTILSILSLGNVKVS